MLPLMINRSDSKFHYMSLQRIDFDLKTVARGKVPENIVREKLSLLKYPSRWLADIGGQFIESRWKCSGRRIGLCTCDVRRGERVGLLSNQLWDIPNDIGLVTKELKTINNVLTAGYLVYLPFISLELPKGNKSTTAISFDWDDFLPNPQKRRTLLTLIKQMDESCLDAYFGKEKIQQYS